MPNKATKRICVGLQSVTFSVKLMPKVTEDNIDMVKENHSAKDKLLSKLNALFAPFLVTM